MRALLKEKQQEIYDLCRTFLVRRLDVFGSVTSQTFDPSRSDIDFVVEFLPCDSKTHYECYFGLLEGLEQLFTRKVDLVEYPSLRNPYFVQALEASREGIYAAWS